MREKNMKYMKRWKSTFSCNYRSNSVQHNYSGFIMMIMFFHVPVWKNSLSTNTPMKFFKLAKNDSVCYIVTTTC